MKIESIFILIFIVFFLTVFTIDLFVTGRRKDKIEVKTALCWTAVWISTALIFSVMIYFYFPNGHEKALEFLASYLIEYSLSVDNLFVFIMIFAIMGVKDKHQPRILKWGIIGAIVLRIIFITGGITVIQHFKFMIYIFGLILIYTAYKMLTSTNEQIDPDKNICVRIASKIFKIKCDADTDHFFVREHNHTYATLALVTLVLIESTDVINTRSLYCHHVQPVCHPWPALSVLCPCRYFVHVQILEVRDIGNSPFCWGEDAYFRLYTYLCPNLSGTDNSLSYCKYSCFNINKSRGVFVRFRSMKT
jgi:hypothetical protein